ncbi:hypothetical protein [Methylobacterium sp.]|uniref:DUF6894 family protein n=1 Tax=unclassified Methylobacterium TaxID=2615210 RepID=UPI00351E1DAD
MPFSTGCLLIEHNANWGVFESCGEGDLQIMARYRFHATNGYAFVLDAVGRDVRRPERLTRRAVEVAESVMEELDDQEDWSEWSVTVHDLSGRRVLVQPFVSRAGGASQAA